MKNSPGVVTRAMTTLRSSPANAFPGKPVTNTAPSPTEAPQMAPGLGVSDDAQFGKLPGASPLSAPMVQNVSNSLGSKPSTVHKRLELLAVITMDSSNGFQHPNGALI